MLAATRLLSAGKAGSGIWRSPRDSRRIAFSKVN